jgi:phospholipase/lecithinase/hemolysin
VRQYAGVRLYNYAVSGGVCSNAITPRYYDAIRGPYPSVSQYEIPAFQADSKVVNKDGSKFLIAPVDQTVYNVWVGANDIGTGGLLTDSQVLGTSIADCVDCVFAQVQKLYNLGARYFTLLNVVPLNLAPLYAMPDAGGVGPNGYWPDKPANHTAVSISMFELVVSNNQIYKYRLPFEVLVQKNFPGARFALFDVNSLVSFLARSKAEGESHLIAKNVHSNPRFRQFRDFYNNPSRYFNGTAPANVTGFIHHCDIHRGNCVNQPSPDSYMWYDELHLSEQTARSIASEYLNVIKGKSKYATYLSG